MKSKLKYLLLVVLLGSGIVYSVGFNPRFFEITAYHPGHTHDAEETTGAPQHSGGTDRYGCHNASVPYHCH